MEREPRMEPSSNSGLLLEELMGAPTHALLLTKWETSKLKVILYALQLLHYV